MSKKLLIYTPVEIIQLKEIIKLNPKVKSRNNILREWCIIHNRSFLGVQYKVSKMLKEKTFLVNDCKLPENVKVEKTSDVQITNTLVLPIKSLRIENNNIIITW